MKIHGFPGRWMVVGALCAAMMACNSSNNETDDGAQTRGLVPVASDAELSAYLRSGLAQHGQAIEFQPGVGSRGEGFVSDMAATNAASGAVSSTNVEVAGVDESDIVKNDGRYLYVNHGDGSGISLHRMEASPARTSKVSDIELAEGSHVEGLFLSGTAEGESDTLVALGYQASDGNWPSGASSVWIYDVADPHSPQARAQVRVSGGILESRRVGRTLYLVTQSSPQYVAEPAIALDLARTVIAPSASEPQALLPKVQIDDGEIGPLVAAEQCLMPAESMRNDAYPVVTTISSVDLDNPQEITSICYVGPVHHFHAAATSLYVAVADYELQGGTYIHKFGIDEGAASYRGTGHVEGYINRDAFRMNEHDSLLRVISTSHHETGIQHHLTILRETQGAGTGMEVVSTLPNKQRQEPIGKPNEDIYGARFMGGKVYLITFQRTDPLYAIDVSDPADPRIEGELEIPGFSNYLHPVNDHLLLGFGRGGEANGSIKVSLFDVEDGRNPKEISSVIIGGAGSWSEIDYDHRTLTFIDGGEGAPLRFALPVMVMNNYEWQHTSLTLFEVDKAGKALIQRGEIIAQSKAEGQNIQWSALNRSVIQGEAIHYLNHDRILSAPWATPDVLSIQVDPKLASPWHYYIGVPVVGEGEVSILPI